MLWCANKCGKLNGSSSPPTSGTSSSGSSPDVISQPYLSFGDYSVFASEMKRAYHEPESKGSQTTMAPASKIPHKNNDQRLPSASDFINKCNGKKILLIFTTQNHPIYICTHGSLFPQMEFTICTSQLDMCVHKLFDTHMLV